MPATAGPAWEVDGGGGGIDRAGPISRDIARTVAVTLLTLTPENAAAASCFITGAACGRYGRLAIRKAETDGWDCAGRALDRGSEGPPSR